MAKEDWPTLAHAADSYRNAERLVDRERIREWLKLKELPSERFTEGLIAVIGQTILKLGARGRMGGLAIIAGPVIADTIDAAAAAFTREYVARAGSVYR